MSDPNIIGGERTTTRLRFRRQTIGGLETHKAKYGGLVFTITRRPKRYKDWPGPGIRATVFLENPNDPPYYYKAHSIKAGKDWCRGALCYILRGTVPFGDHSDDSERS